MHASYIYRYISHQLVWRSWKHEGEQHYPGSEQREWVPIQELLLLQGLNQPPPLFCFHSPNPHLWYPPFQSQRWSHLPCPCHSSKALFSAQLCCSTWRLVWIQNMSENTTASALSPVSCPCFFRRFLVGNKAAVYIHAMTHPRGHCFVDFLNSPVSLFLSVCSVFLPLWGSSLNVLAMKCCSYLPMYVNSLMVLHVCYRLSHPPF